MKIEAIIFPTAANLPQADIIQLNIKDVICNFIKSYPRHVRQLNNNWM